MDKAVNAWAGAGDIPVRFAPILRVAQFDFLD